MDRYQATYESVRRLYESLMSLKEKQPTYLIGLAGELLVKTQLTESRIPFEAKGGQAGYDILLCDRESNNRIEVRSSTLKNEGIYSEKIMSYGWRLQNWNEEEIGYDYLVCVAFDDVLSNPRFYLFRRDEVMKANDVQIGRFGKVRKKLHLFRTLDEMEKAVAEKRELVTQWEITVNQKRKNYENRWKILK